MPDIKSILRHFFISITPFHDSAHLTCQVSAGNLQMCMQRYF